jgi:hypothetical protein
MAVLVDALAHVTPASAVCLAVSVHAAYSIPYFLFVDARLADFDPRPAVRRAIESGRFDTVLTVVGPAKRDARHAPERLVRAALHAPLTALRHHAPKGTTR